MHEHAHACNQTHTKGMTNHSYHIFKVDIYFTA